MRDVHMLGDPWSETDEGETEIQMRIAEHPDDEEPSDEATAQGMTLPRRIRSSPRACAAAAAVRQTARADQRHFL